MSQLRLPLKARRILRLHRNHFPNNVPSVHINRTNSHDLSSVVFIQLPAEYHDQSDQLIYLFPLIIPERVLEPLLESHKGHVHFGRPPNLASAKSRLGLVIENPLFPWFFFVGGHCLRYVVPY